MHFTERNTAGERPQSQFLETPFAESDVGRRESGPLGFIDGGEAFSPFATEGEFESQESETDRLLAEALSELHDDGFDDAVAFLAEETEGAVADRYADEAPSHGVDRERFADLHLVSVRYEVEGYLEALESGLQGLDLQSLNDAQLASKLDQFDPQTRELSPAGEEFVGSLIRKAKKAVKFVVKTAGKLASPLLRPVLNRLKALIRPLLQRVLAIAIGRLPAPLQPAAKQLSSRLKFEGEEGEAAMSPANFSDLEDLTNGFDAALAEAAIGTVSDEAAYEHEDEWSGEAASGQQLERLGEARGVLIDAMQSGDAAAITPAIEQFVPVLLGALKLGINLVGRPKVVRFLAGYVGQLIKKWVGPQAAGPLANAIVDIGLRMVSLEDEDEDEADARTREAAPVALASVIEDTVRRLAESESYVFEDEDLTQLAVAEAFGAAVATHFPARFVQPRMRQTATLGGTFVARRPRSARSYSKYSRIPEIEITPQIADAIPTYGGATLGNALRAAGIGLPLRARIHLYQASPGSTVAAILRTDRGLSRSGGMMPQGAAFHPLTPIAAGLLLREPGLGANTPAAFLRSQRRLGVGQRIYALQPIGSAMIGAAAPRHAVRAATGRLAPSRTRVAVDRQRGRLSVSLYFSEVDAQRIAQAIREGRGHAALLQGLIEAWRRGDGSASRASLQQEDGEDSEGEALAPGLTRLGGAIRRALLGRLRRWAAPALAAWAKQNAEAFARASADPATGVTVRLRLGPIAGLDGNAAAIARIATGPAPNITIGITPGFSRP